MSLNNLLLSTFNQKLANQSRQFNTPASYGKPLVDPSTNGNVTLITNSTTTLLIENTTLACATQTYPSDTWSYNNNLASIVNFTKFGYGSLYGTLMPDAAFYPAIGNYVGYAFSLIFTVIDDKFFAFPPPLNYTSITSYQISKSKYTFPRYSSTDGVNWVEDGTVTYSNTDQFPSAVIVTSKWYIRVLKPGVIACVGEAVGLKSSTTEGSSANAPYGWPSILLSTDGGVTFNNVGGSLATDLATQPGNSMKAACAALVNNDPDLINKDYLSSAFQSYGTPKIFWVPSLSKYVMYDGITRTYSGFSPYSVYNSNGILYFSSDLLNWSVKPVPYFGGVVTSTDYQLLVAGDNAIVMARNGSYYELYLDPNDSTGVSYRVVNSTSTSEIFINAYYNAASNRIIGYKSVARTSSTSTASTTLYSTIYTPAVSSVTYTGSVSPVTSVSGIALFSHRNGFPDDTDVPGDPYSFWTNNVYYPVLPKITTVGGSSNIQLTFDESLMATTLPVHQKSYNWAASNYIDKIDSTYYIASGTTQAASQVLATTDWQNFTQYRNSINSVGLSEDGSLIRMSNGDYAFITSSYSAAYTTSLSTETTWNRMAYGAVPKYAALVNIFSSNGYHNNVVYSAAHDKFVYLSWSRNELGSSSGKIGMFDGSANILLNPAPSSTPHAKFSICAAGDYYYVGCKGGYLLRHSFTDIFATPVQLYLPNADANTSPIGLTYVSNINRLIVFSRITTTNGSNHALCYSDDYGNTWSTPILMPSGFRTYFYWHSPKNLIAYDETTQCVFVSHDGPSDRYYKTIFKIDLVSGSTTSVGGVKAMPQYGIVAYNGSIYFGTRGSFVEVKTS